MLTLATSAHAAEPIKRLAWSKAAAVWTAQGKERGDSQAVLCSTWSLSRSTLSCTLYDPRPSPSAATIVAGERHRVYGSVSMSRYDRAHSGLRAPRVGCTYQVEVRVGSQVTRRLVLDICRERWVRLLPRLG